MNNSNNDQTSHLQEVVTSSPSFFMNPWSLNIQFKRIIAASSANLSVIFPSTLRQCVHDLRMSSHGMLKDRRYITRDFIAYAKSTMKDNKIAAQAFYQNYIKQEIWQ